MASEMDVSLVISALSAIRACPDCATRIRFGDLECPHCGQDLEESQRNWAAQLVDRLAERTDRSR